MAENSLVMLSMPAKLYDLSRHDLDPNASVSYRRYLLQPPVSPNTERIETIFLLSATYWRKIFRKRTNLNYNS